LKCGLNVSIRRHNARCVLQYYKHDEEINEIAYCLPHQIDQIRRQAPIAYIPVGSLEWHEAHLPVSPALRLPHPTLNAGSPDQVTHLRLTGPCSKCLVATDNHTTQDVRRAVQRGPVLDPNAVGTHESEPFPIDRPMLVRDFLEPVRRSK